MTMLTFSYKKHYIHVKSIGNTEKVEAYILDNSLENFSTFKVYTVKSIQSAKRLITKHVNSLK